VSSARPLEVAGQPDFFIGRGSIIEGSFKIEYTGPEQKPNSIEVEFLDRNQNYEKNIWRANSPDLTNAQQATIRDYRVDSMDLFGVTSRSQAERQANYLINSNRFLKRSGSFDMTIEGLPLEPGDVFVLSHDILPRGVSGRLIEYSEDTDRKKNIVPDEPFTIGAGTTSVYVRDHRTDEVEKRTVTSPAAGSYSAGTTVVLDSDLTAVPEPGVTTYTIVNDGDELFATVTGIEYREDLTCTVNWLEYDEQVFVDDASEETTEELLGDGLNSPNGSGQNQGSNRAGPDTLLDGPDSVGVTSRSDRDVSISRPLLEVGWQYSPSEAVRATETKVWVRRISDRFVDQVPAPNPRDGAAWSLLGTAPPGATSIEGVCPVPLKLGQRVEVCVQGRNLRGLSRRLLDCPKFVHTYSGGGYSMAPLSSFAVDQEGVLAEYSWTHPDDVVPTVEIRRGGWQLGQVVARVRGTDTGYIDNLVSSISGDPFRLHASAIDSANEYSAPVQLDYNPTIPTESEEFAGDFAEQAWETYVDGWFTDDVLQPAEDPVLTDLVVAAGGYLEFTGTSLTATYETWNPQLGSPAKLTAAVIQRVFVEAGVEAECVNDETWDERSTYWGEWPTAWEGSGATMVLEWSITRDGLNWSSFAEFKPGIHEIALARFRLSFTRDTDSHNIKVHRFHTRIRYVEPSVTERSQRTEYLRTEMF
jgi:hypothetical protein